jgi:hypothetical protein
MSQERTAWDDFQDLCRSFMDVVMLVIAGIIYALTH